MHRWFLRISWITLPATVGPALGELVSGWAAGPMWVIAITAWASWTACVIAVLSPRPWGLTLLRVLGPWAMLGVVVIALESGHSAGLAYLGLAGASLALGFTLAPQTAVHFASGGAYGDEQRFPLKIPRPIAIVIAPIAVLGIGSAALGGPLLLADERWVIGLASLAVGAAVIWPLAHGLHTLSKRWVVLVPAGLVLVDPLVLADPVLFPKERILGLGEFAGEEIGSSPIGRSQKRSSIEAVDGVLDLRQGMAFQTCALQLSDAARIAVHRAGRRSTTEFTDADVILFCPLDPGTLITQAGKRRIPTGKPSRITSN